MSSNSNRNDYLDIVKGFAMILVILGHSMEVSAGKEARANLSFFVDPVHDFIYSFHMPLFMAEYLPIRKKYMHSLRLSVCW